MRKQTIYLDTSVIGGCFDIEFQKWSNKLFADIKSGFFIPVISVVTESEIENAPLFVQNRLLELLALEHIFLETNDEVFILADKYIERNIVTEKYYDDATHIALSTVNKIDLLVSWNFKHIVHFDKIHRFNAVNLENGYSTINIYSPMEVATNE